MKASDLFIKCLEAEGVEYIFGIPGEENLDMLESIRNSNIKLIVTRHEQGAGFMAAAYGRLTGKVGVCLSTLGPGATNFVTCASYALLGGMPVMFITGQKPIKTSKQGRFQILDVVRMMNPITQYTRQIVNANNIPSVIRESFRIALKERPGPVHIELPEDIAAEDVEKAPFEVTAPRRPEADEKSVHKAIEMIEAAKHPLLLVAYGANRKRISNSLNKFVEKTGIYFCNTQMGKGVIDERSDKFIGTAALSDNDYLHCAINRADLIINVGHEVVEKPPFFMEPGGVKVIHVNFSRADMDDVYFPQHEVIGDIGNSMWRIMDSIEPQSHWDFTYFEKIRQEVETNVYTGKNDDRFPLVPQRFVHDVRAATDDDAVLSLDNGMYKIWFARNYKSYGPNTMLLDNALATMGAGLPVAIATKMVYPNKQVLAVCGDGGFMMNSQELETAVRLGLDGLTVLLLRDDSYGMIRWKQAGMNFPDWGLEFGNPDFVKYAESYGAHGVRIESAGQLEGTIRECFNSKGVHLIDCPIDYTENNKVFLQELKEKVCLL